MPPKFELEIIYGKTESLPAEETAPIQDVKVAAMALFGIPASEAGNYILRTKVHGKDVQLDEAKTVAGSELHNHQKVTLAAGAPFGRR